MCCDAAVQIIIIINTSTEINAVISLKLKAYKSIPNSLFTIRQN
jgi:hypothetical protein